MLFVRVHAANMAHSLFFAVLTKKVALPNNSRLHCVSWNQEHGWLAAGCDGGILKVLKFEVEKTDESSLKGIAAQLKMSMNQNLEGHKDRACCGHAKGASATSRRCATN